MPDPSIESVPSARTSPNWLHYLNLVWNGLTLLVLIPFFFMILTGSSEGETSALRGLSKLSIYLIAGVILFFTCMALIGFIDSLRKVMNKSKPARALRWRWLFYTLIAFFPILFAIKQWGEKGLLPDWLFAMLIFMAIFIPIVWLVRVVGDRQWGGHAGRHASLFNWSASVSVPYIMILQLMLVILLVIVAMSSPGFVLPNLENLAEIEAYLKKPIVLYSIFLLLSVFAPIIEELFKTLAVWPLLGLRITAREGYLAGLMSGAAFALFEGVLYASQYAGLGDGNWLFLIFGRFGGSLLHIFNGGLIGWALAKTWLDKQYYRAGLAYLSAMIIHGLWNFTVFITQIVPTVIGEDPNPIGSTLPLAVLAVIVALGFVLLGNYVAKEQNQMSQEAYGA